MDADATRGLALLTKACDHTVDGCFDLGRALVESDGKRAIEVFTKECETDSRGCDALGDLYRVGIAELPRDRKQAYSLYDRACRSGDDFDCFKRDCMHGDDDHCYRVRQMQKTRTNRLGGRFDE